MKSTTPLILGTALVAAVGVGLLAVLSPKRDVADPDTGGDLDQPQADPGPGASAPLSAPASLTPGPDAEAAASAGRISATVALADPADLPPPPPEPGPLTGFVVDFEGADGVPGVIVELVCAEARLKEECRTDLSGRFETETSFPLLPTTARIIDPEGGGVVGTFAWRWDAERGVMRGVKRSRSGALQLPVAIGPTFVFDVTPRELRSRALRARIIEVWSAGALSGVLVRRPDDQEYQLRTTPRTPYTRVGSAMFPNRRGPRHSGRSVIRSSSKLESWGDRPVRGEGPCWIRYGRGREPRGFGSTPYLEVELRSAGIWDRVPVSTLRGVHPGILVAQPTRRGDLTGTLFDDQMQPIAGAVVGVLAGHAPRFDGWATTNQAGRFLFTEAPAGEYELVITREGLAPAARSVKVTARDGTTPARLHLPAWTELVAVTGTVWCPHDETVLLELVPEQDGQERRHELLEAGRGQKQGDGTLMTFYFRGVPRGPFEIVLQPVAPRAGLHMGMPYRMQSEAPASNLQLRCGEGRGTVEHFLQVVPAPGASAGLPFSPQAAFGPIGPLRRDKLAVGPGNAVQLGAFPAQSPFQLLAWSKGFRPAFLGPGAFEAGEDPELARVARTELRPGWGTRLYFLDATSLLPDELEENRARSQRRRLRNRDFDAVLAARPLAGVRVLAQGRELARSDARGVAWLVADVQPLSLELYLPGWRASQLDRSRTGGPLDQDLIWMVPE